MKAAVISKYSSEHRNLIYRMRIRTLVGFFAVQSNGASVVGKGVEEKIEYLKQSQVFMLNLEFDT
jgi:hypothetical protein